MILLGKEMNRDRSAPKRGPPDRQDRRSGGRMKKMDHHVQLTESILKCVYDMANELGVGFLENVYKNALAVALKDQSLKVEIEKVFEIVFRKRRVGLYIADLVVEDTVIVETKCCSALLPAHQAQLINYLAASSCPVGLLVNFGNKRLEIKRLRHPRYQLMVQDGVVPF